MQDSPQPARLEVSTCMSTGRTALLFILEDDDGMAYEFLRVEDIDRLITSLVQAKSLMAFLVNHRQERDSHAAIKDIETNILHKGGSGEISP